MNKKIILIAIILLALIGIYFYLIQTKSTQPYSSEILSEIEVEIIDFKPDPSFDLLWNNMLAEDRGRMFDFIDKHEDCFNRECMLYLCPDYSTRVIWRYSPEGWVAFDETFVFLGEERLTHRFNLIDEEDEDKLIGRFFENDYQSEISSDETLTITPVYGIFRNNQGEIRCETIRSRPSVLF